MPSDPGNAIVDGELRLTEGAQAIIPLKTITDVVPLVNHPEWCNIHLGEAVVYQVKMDAQEIVDAMAKVKKGETADA